jgi:hypothetical protein
MSTLELFTFLTVLIVSSYKKEVLKILKTLIVLLNKELSPIIVTKKEFWKQFSQKHRLYQEIVNGKRILVSGEYNFWQDNLKV